MLVLLVWGLGFENYCCGLMYKEPQVKAIWSYGFLTAAGLGVEWNKKEKDLGKACF